MVCSLFHLRAERCMPLCALLLKGEGKETGFSLLICDELTKV